MHKQGFQIEDEPLEPIITLSKKIGEEFLVELSARAIERNSKENERNRERFIHELEHLTNDLEIKLPAGEQLLRIISFGKVNKNSFLMQRKRKN